MSNENREFYFDRNDEIEQIGKRTMRKHCHSHFEIYYITKGNCCYFIENKVYHLMPGDIILIPAGVMHNTQYQNTIYSRMLISCSDHYIPDEIKARLDSILHLYRNPNISGEISSIFEKIEAEQANKDELSDEMFRAYTLMLFSMLLRNPNLCEPQEDRHYIDSALDYLQNNFTDDITLSEISKKYFVSPEHFSRVFKQKTGFNFSEYLNILRLQKAEQMLKQLNTAPMTEIAAACGFNDSNYFSLKFKMFFGISPKKFQTNSKDY